MLVARAVHPRNAFANEHAHARAHVFALGEVVAACLQYILQGFRVRDEEIIFLRRVRCGAQEEKTGTHAEYSMDPPRATVLVLPREEHIPDFVLVRDLAEIACKAQRRKESADSAELRTGASAHQLGNRSWAGHGCVRLFAPAGVYRAECRER
jgi:hypothetical protein